MHGEDVANHSISAPETYTHRASLPAIVGGRYP